MTKPKRSLEDGKRERANAAKAANARERNIAQQYLNAGPSIGNLARAVYHYWNSVPMLGGQDESGNILITGEAPSPGMKNPKDIVNKASQVKRFIKNPENLVKDFIKRNHGKTRYVRDIAEDIYGLNPNLQNVDYKAMNKYGNIFNKRIKRTIPLAKARGTLRSDKEPNVFVADPEGRRRLYDTFINDTPTLKWDRTVHIGDPVTDKGKLAKDYYYKTKPAEDVFDTTPSSFADRKNNTIVVIPNRGYKNMYRYTIPHEKTHIFINGQKEAKLFGTDRGFGVRPHKAGDTNIDLDLYLSAPDEQLARGTQIKNYLGIVDESPITPEQLKYAAQNYVKDTGYDNNMTDFFSMIEDYDKAAKWLSMAPLIAAPLVAAPIITNRTEKRNGGSIYIAPSKRGTFTAAATKHGMGVQEFASKVLRNKDSYSPAMVKKANFARNASKWNH